MNKHLIKRFLKKGIPKANILKNINKSKSDKYYKKGLHFEEYGFGILDAKKAYKYFKKSVKYNINNIKAIEKLFTYAYDQGKYK